MTPEVSTQPISTWLGSTWPEHALRVSSFADLVAIYEPRWTLVAAPLEVSTAQRAVLESAASSLPCFEFARESAPTGEPLEYALPWFDGHPAGETWLGLARPLVLLFAELFEAERVGVRLALSDRPLCPRFHVDNVVCRLVVSLAGAGSEFIAQDDVRRGSLGASDSPVERQGALVHQVDTLDMVLMKGEAWPQNQGRGVVHRSPAGTEPRLVMTVDLL